MLTALLLLLHLLETMQMTTLVLLPAVAIASASASKTTYPFNDPTLDTDKRVADLLSRCVLC